MSSFPTHALGDIFGIARGGSPRPISEYITDDPDGVNWVMIADASAQSKYIQRTRKKIRKEGVSRSRQVAPGDFLLTNSMSFGRPYIMATSGCIHDGWLVLAPKREISHDYFFHVLGSSRVYAEFERLAAGVTVKNLNIDLVSGVQVPVPPLAEQRRIARILDQADDLRRKRREALALTETFLRSAFLERFGDVVANDRGWPTMSVGDAGDVLLGRMRAPKYQSGLHTTPYLRVANVYEDRIDLTDVLSMDFDEEERRRYGLERQDILLNEGQSTELVGRPAMWQAELPLCCFQNALIRFRADRRRLVPEFALSVFLEYLRKGVFAKASSKTSNVAHLSAGRFSRLAMVVPPLDVQTPWEAIRRAIRAHQRRLEQAAAATDGLFAALTHRAFRGEL